MRKVVSSASMVRGCSGVGDADVDALAGDDQGLLGS